ncbi:UNVERIFIED_CONTAM: hypothetical protein Sradi_5729800 [Sesamum radiatum]|uniref:Chromo domain-containing protein n=1 Tax=Sesamum radiatum TaxID=300843 RepID=A0AAW2L225_SESRA
MSLSYVSMPKRALPPTSAFEIVTGQQPLLPHTLDSPQSVRSPLARSFSQESKQNVDIARSCLEKAQKQMKKYADQNRRFIEFSAGDLKYVGPLPITKRIGTVAYRIELPSWWKIHNVFHVRQLKKYSADKEDDTRNQPSRPQLELTKMKEKVAEVILNHRVTRTAKREHTEYLVKWKGCSSEENTWERVANLKAFLPLVEAYLASHAPRTSLSQLCVRCCYSVGALCQSRQVCVAIRSVRCAKCRQACVAIGQKLSCAADN